MVSATIERLRLTPVTLGAAACGLVLADVASELAGDSFFPGGPADELAHLLTMLLVLWALGVRARRFAAAALIASVAIDLDHVPGYLGANWLTAGTPRPYTHSLLTLAVLLTAALFVRSHRDLLLGVVVGLAVHFFRDLGEPGSGVALLWPWSRDAERIPHVTYGVVMALVTLVCLGRLSYSSHIQRTRRAVATSTSPSQRETPQQAQLTVNVP